ncbi:MAG TPA: accessory factor UbiK family protein [Thermopetrobacter sp.]|nr:accessory factor UbiK family protein [Thermopetrobacter sp.]
MSGQSNFFDELAKAFSGAAGVAQGLRKEIDSLIAAQLDRVVSELDLVRREEFEVVREMASRARQETRALKTKVAELEAEIARLRGAPRSGRDEDGEAG